MQICDAGKNKTCRIIDLLSESYPNASIALNYATPWQLLVSVVLSAQTTDAQVNRVTAELFPKYTDAKFEIGDLKFEKEITPKIQEIINYAQVSLEELQEDISSVGFYKNKAKYIKESARIILEKFDGQISDRISDLTKLPGVARKTANVIIGNLYGAEAMEGIAVDTHVSRISQRLRLVDLGQIGKGKKKFFEKDRGNELDYKTGINADKVEKQLMGFVPKKDWFKFTYWIIDHGRKICKAQNPKCGKCPLKTLCPSSRV